MAGRGIDGKDDGQKQRRRKKCGDVTVSIHNWDMGGGGTAGFWPPINPVLSGWRLRQPGLSQLPPYVTLEIRSVLCSSFTDPQGPDIDKEFNQNGVEVKCF